MGLLDDIVVVVEIVCGRRVRALPQYLLDALAEWNVISSLHVRHNGRASRALFGRRSIVEPTTTPTPAPKSKTLPALISSSLDRPLLHTLPLGPSPPPQRSVPEPTPMHTTNDADTTIPTMEPTPAPRSSFNQMYRCFQAVLRHQSATTRANRPAQLRSWAKRERHSPP
jgi:hypothetical protein